MDLKTTENSIKISRNEETWSDEIKSISYRIGSIVHEDDETLEEMNSYKDEWEWDDSTIFIDWYYDENMEIIEELDGELELWMIRDDEEFYEFSELHSLFQDDVKIFGSKLKEMFNIDELLNNDTNIKFKSNKGEWFDLSYLKK